MVPFKSYLAENISLQKCNSNIFGLTATVALFGNEARFCRFRAFFAACYLQNEVGDPPFFFTFITSLTHHLNGKILRKKSMLENFRANVLK